VIEAARMRADARRNRLAILAAAEEAFAAEGLGVPVDDVARRAGVGAGTLYRHFPTKEALFEAVLVHHIEELTAEARALAESDQPGSALFDFLAKLARQAGAKRNLIDALSGAGINIKATASEPKAELERATEVLLTRAQQAGEARPDVTVAELFGLVMGACAFAGNDTSACSHARMVAVVCDGLRLERPSGVISGDLEKVQVATSVEVSSPT
jgi:AcrR family transcriptional regulator